MRLEAITLVFAMGLGGVMMAACDDREQQHATFPASQSVKNSNDGQLRQDLPLPASITRGPEAVQVANPPPRRPEGPRPSFALASVPIYYRY
jgi:hypothetical protein